MIPIASPELSEEEKRRVEEVLDSGMIADGPEVRSFEDEFAEFCGTEYGVATSNGTTALHTAFEALDIGEGDTVVTSPFSFVASANAIRLAGAAPVFADINPDTFNLDPQAVEDIVQERDVDAILAVHLYGLPADLGQLRDIADEHDLVLVEDAAQAHGAEYNGVKVGSFGDAACFSFYPTKNMTTGEGGMITTDRDDVAEKAASFANHGRSVDGGYEHIRVGQNYRMTSIAAVIGQVQLDRLPEYVEARRANAALLNRGLADSDLITPVEPSDCRHSYHQYTVRAGDREELAEYLEDAGVGTGVYYPTPIHKQPAYEDITCSAPVSEEVANDVLSLPVHPELSTTDIETITQAVHEYEAQR
ncbi:DegT/DnrJ/EryC1/StrS family aminotransferase [Halobacterium salinarum]|uniref:DegT/DnrJ/EryC1/StrS family aminotransferase n=1 Tax=Halobacterium salinarum TaxID=2242 RepID=UPI0025547D05|nr:DegT/DnrJ/EryC1/StrS family aminotransferase [Halobacterium salinarum]MDL0141617.1 DegT/DnrJ/EryC1/StrS family aminotransferase [Halobacterium salinarum]